MDKNVELWGRFEDEEKTIIEYFMTKEEYSNRYPEILKYCKKLEFHEIIKYKLEGKLK